MNTTIYCTGWNSIFCEPAEILSADVAAKLHQERKPYCAIIENKKGQAVVEMCFFKIYCHTLFLDEKKRIAYRYSFVETSDGRLFQKEAAIHYYSDEGYRPSSAEFFRFKEDGTIVHDTGKVGGPITRKEGRTDVSRNYSPIPEFGKYESILARER